MFDISYFDNNIKNNHFLEHVLELYNAVKNKFDEKLQCQILDLKKYSHHLKLLQ